MRALSYLDLDVLIERGDEEGTYRSRIVDAPSGPTGPAIFRLPFSDLELENFLLKVGQPRRALSRGLAAGQEALIEAFGGKLFNALFGNDLSVTLATSLAQAEGQQAGLRVRLRLTDVPELGDIPWEFLWDPRQRMFLALSEGTPLVRYLDLPGAVRPLKISPPMRVLVLVASPSDLRLLDADAERARMGHALQDLARTNQVVVDTAPDGRLASLGRMLRREDYHVLHFIGHGTFDSESSVGLLAFEDAQGRAQKVRANHLGTILHDHRSLRMVVLNSCEGARGGLVDPYAGTAQTLVRHRVPAVVAMQFEITDEAAITFSHTLYESIADGYPVDAAVAQARLAICSEDNPIEWATPVLYLAAPDGHIFDVQPSVPGESPGENDHLAAQQPPPPLADDPDYVAALAEIKASRWHEVVRRLTDVKSRYPHEQAVAEQLVHARRQLQLELWDIRAESASRDQRLTDSQFALERVVELDPTFRGASQRLRDVRTQLAELDSTPEPSKGRKWWPAVPAGAAVVIALLVGAVVVLRIISTTARLDEDRILVAIQRGESSRIFSVPSQGEAKAELTQTAASAELPSISRGRDLLGYVADGRPRLVSVEGEDDRELFPDGDPLCDTAGRPAWEPDGSQVALWCTSSPSREGLFLLDRDGRNARSLAPGKTRGPVFSPDGALIAYFMRPRDAVDGVGGLYVVTTDPPAVVTRIRDGQVAEPDWSSPGSRLVFRQRTGRSWAIDTARFDASEPTLSDAPELVSGTADCAIATTDSAAVGIPSWSPDGKRIAFRCGTELYVMPAREGATPTRIETPAGTVTAISWSPR